MLYYHIQYQGAEKMTGHQPPPQDAKKLKFFLCLSPPPLKSSLLLEEIAIFSTPPLKIKDIKS